MLKVYANELGLSDALVVHDSLKDFDPIFQV
jgi:hypothetical protein